MTIELKDGETGRSGNGTHEMFRIYISEDEAPK